MSPETGNVLFILVVVMLCGLSGGLLSRGIPWYYALMPIYIPVVLIGLYMLLWFGWGYGGWFT